jgi:hypothetical protein
MQKTVNQWLDWIDSLPSIQRDSSDILDFRHMLMKFKLDEKYEGYGGTLIVKLPDNLEYLNKKSK